MLILFCALIWNLVTSAELFILIIYLVWLVSSIAVVPKWRRLKIVWFSPFPSPCRLSSTYIGFMYYILSSCLLGINLLKRCNLWTAPKSPLANFSGAWVFFLLFIGSLWSFNNYHYLQEILIHTKIETHILFMWNDF